MRKNFNLLGDDRGAAAVEFALVSPFFIAMLLAIISYGGYFWLSHEIQQTANDGARAMVAGLDAAERLTLARTSIRQALRTYPLLDNAHASVDMQTDTDQSTVTLTYDASGTPFWALGALVPMPPSQIVRSATVRLGGY